MTTGHVHAAGYYTDEDDLRDTLTPLLSRTGPLVIAHESAELIRSWLPEPGTATVLPWAEVYANPAKTIATYQRLFDSLLTGPATRIRLVGATPLAESTGRNFGWDRYEAAVNQLWRDYPLDSLCLYQAPTAWLKDVLDRTHPATPTSRNPHYDPTFSALPSHHDPLESDSPLHTLTDPTPAESRHTVQQTAHHRLPTATTEDLVFAVSEATTNAHLHGTGPSTVRVWASPTRVVVRVSDTGPGPSDPFAGLTPALRDRGGLGLWLAHQLDIEVALITEPAGFTVRLRAGDFS
ncbi:ATP-binding protein [Actinokineospora guangxiensis]|uniref:ATP-binding protein n=1 Tax=Actinokineospora guangxiensis TaxID=1490288 RepID=A0ABW0ER16_9PSEU